VSPGLLRVLRAVERDTRQLASGSFWSVSDTARYPRDYYRPAELLRLWRRAPSCLRNFRP
jgi:hypothetical protein